MKTKNEFEFKGATIDDAIASGLKELGLSIDQVDIEKKSYGGIFTKACVIITPKQQPIAEAETAEEAAPAVETAVSEAEPEEAPAAKQTELVSDEMLKAKERSLEFVKQVVSLMGANCEVEGDIIDGEINISVNGDDAGQIIGFRGEVLDAIQYLTLLQANRGEKDFARVQLDAGSYRKKRKDTLANLARRLAVKAARTSRRVELEPMNPFERRVIHTTLADNKDVTTQSEGEGKYRHVIIIPNTEDASEGTATYGQSNFRRKGPAKTRSFGYKGRRF